MDIRLKERLVGAAVLVAAAFILIPEMLSGPHAQDPPATAQTDGAVRSFSIDLSKSPSHPDTITAIPPTGETHLPDPNQAPPPEMSAAPSATETTATPPAPIVQSEIANGTSSSEPPPAVEKPAPRVEPAEKPSPSPIAKSIEKEKPAVHAQEQASANHQWAVQVGSFGNDAIAQKVAQEFKQKGYPAFVMPFKKEGKTLYRVRIGPQSQRSAADAVFAKLKHEGETNVVVVAHP